MPEKGYNFTNSEKRLKMAKGTRGTIGYKLFKYPLEAALYKGFAFLVHFGYRYKGAKSGKGTKGTFPLRECTLVPSLYAAVFSYLF